MTNIIKDSPSQETVKNSGSILYNTAYTDTFTNFAPDL